MIGVIAMLAVAAAETPDLEGRYALEMRVRSTAKVPMARSVSTQISTGLVDVRRGPSGLEHTQSVCAVWIEDRSPLARTLIPDAFVAALPITLVRATLSADGGYTVDLGTSHVGYDPTLTDALPRTATDPAVLDWEGDGRPGGTIRVQVFGLGTFGIDVVQRSRAVLDGVVGADGAIEGQVRTELLEQQVIGADKRFLETTPEIEPDPAGSTFRMVPVPSDTTCTTLPRSDDS